MEIPPNAARREIGRNEVVIIGSVKQKKISHDAITDANSKRLFPLFSLLAIIDNDMYRGPKDTAGNPTNRKGHCSIQEMDDFTDAQGEIYKHWLLHAVAKPIEPTAANQHVFKLRQYIEEVDEGRWNTVKYGTQVKDKENPDIIESYAEFSVADSAVERLCMTALHTAAKAKTDNDTTNVAF